MLTVPHVNKRYPMLTVFWGGLERLPHVNEIPHLNKRYPMLTDFSPVDHLPHVIKRYTMLTVFSRFC